MKFKINSRLLITVIFKLKNDNFKTRDFSLLIERVLAGVNMFSPCSAKRRASDKDLPVCTYIFLMITESTMDSSLRPKTSDSLL